MPPRRILLLTTTYEYPQAGTEGQIRALVENLPAPWEAELWVLKPDRLMDWAELGFPVRCLEITKLKRLGTLARLPALARSIREAGFSAILTYMADAGFIGCLAGRLARLPVIVSRRDMGIWHTPVMLRAARFTARFAKGFIANCEAVKRLTVETERVDPADVHVIENGIDRARFDQPACADLRGSLGIPADAPLMGMVGNFREVKRHADLIDALALLTGDVSNLHLVLVGRHLEPAMEHARRRGVDTRVRAFAVAGDVVPILKNLDVGALCSDSEGLSNAILEYLGCGLPVVASNVGGNPELVTDGDNGLLFEAGDVRGLAEALGRVFLDANLRARFGAASLKSIEGRFTIDGMVHDTLALLD